MLLLLLSCLPIPPAAAEPIPVVDFLPCLGPSTYRLLPTEHGMGVLCMSDLYGQVVLSDPSGTQTWSLGQNARTLALTQYSPRTRVDAVVQDLTCDGPTCVAVVPLSFQATPGVLEADLVWAGVGFPGATPSPESNRGVGKGTFVGRHVYETAVLRAGSQLRADTGAVVQVPGQVVSAAAAEHVDLVVASSTHDGLFQALSLVTLDAALQQEPVVVELGVQGTLPVVQVLRVGETVHVVAQVSQANLNPGPHAWPAFLDGPSELILATVQGGQVTRTTLDTQPSSLSAEGMPSAQAAMRWDAALHGEVVWLLLGDADPATPPVLRAIAGVPTP